MVNRLVALAFLLALGLASSAAAQESCWYCECNGGRCICVEVVCPTAAPSDPVFDQSSPSASPDSVTSQLFSRMLVTAPVEAQAIMIEGPLQLEDGSFRWNLVWGDSHGDFLASAGFATSYMGAQQAARKLASQRGVELIDKTREK